MKARILYVEDDESLGFVTRDNLEQQGYLITHCVDGNTALAKIRKGEFDLALLDVMLPETDGFTLAQEIRKFDRATPIIFLTAKSLKEDKLHGLKIGGDDYITKPFSIEELLLKVEIFLRRRTLSEDDNPRAAVYRLGSYEFDHDNLSLKREGEERTLTKREADLLRFLADNQNVVIERGDILERIWGENDYFLGRSLDVFISRLRKYLSADESLKIENIHGVGFRFRV